MVDVAAGFGIDHGYAGAAIEMAGEVGELVGQDLEDRRIDLDAANPPGAEKQAGENVTAATDADDGDVGRRLHQIGAVDHVVPEVGELAEVAVEFGDNRPRIRIDVEEALFDSGFRRVRKTPAERDGVSLLHPH